MRALLRSFALPPRMYIPTHNRYSTSFTGVRARNLTHPCKVSWGFIYLFIYLLFLLYLVSFIFSVFSMSRGNYNKINAQETSWIRCKLNLHKIWRSKISGNVSCKISGFHISLKFCNPPTNWSLPIHGASVRTALRFSEPKLVVWLEELQLWELKTLELFGFNFLTIFSVWKL